MDPFLASLDILIDQYDQMMNVFDAIIWALIAKRRAPLSKDEGALVRDLQRRVSGMRREYDHLFAPKVVGHDVPACIPGVWERLPDGTLIRK